MQDYSRFLAKKVFLEGKWIWKTSQTRESTDAVDAINRLTISTRDYFRDMIEIDLFFQSNDGLYTNCQGSLKAGSHETSNVELAHHHTS